MVVGSAKELDAKLLPSTNYQLPTKQERNKDNETEDRLEGTGERGEARAARRGQWRQPWESEAASRERDPPYTEGLTSLHGKNDFPSRVLRGERSRVPRD